MACQVPTKGDSLSLVAGSLVVGFFRDLADAAADEEQQRKNRQCRVTERKPHGDFS